MRILLLSPPTPEPTRWGRKVHDVRPVYLPLGLAMIAAVAERAGAEVKVHDANVEPLAPAAFEAMLRGFAPDVVGIQALIMSAGESLSLARNVRRVLPSARIVLGGAQATQNGVEMMRAAPEVDAIVVGEGEDTFAELLDAVAAGRDLSSVAGLLVRADGDPVFTFPRDPVADIDALPYPARRFFHVRRYTPSPLLRGRRVMDLLTNRGCPFRCTFCHTRAMPRYRPHSVDRVLGEIRLLRNDYRCDSLYFHDDLFSASRPRTVELCEAMIRERLAMPWACLTHVARVDRELLEIMQKSGCYQIWFGVESGVQRLLDFIQKDYQLEQAVDALRHCNRLGIMTHALYIIGLPGETSEETAQTVRFAVSLDSCFAMFSIATPLPGTRMFEHMQDPALGTIIDRDESHYDVFTNAVYVPAGRTPVEIRAWHRRAYRTFYLRPRYVLKMIPHLARYPLVNLLAFAKTAFKQLILR